MMASGEAEKSTRGSATIRDSSMTNGPTSHVKNGNACFNGAASSEGKATGDVSRQGTWLERCLDLPLTKLPQDVPLVFHEPYVETGFRVVGQPWRYYFLSIFQNHNEVMNVWTHIFAAFLIMWEVYFFGQTIDFIDDPYTWPLLSGMLCSITLFWVSTGAHCLQSKSELVHYTCFMVDYMAIGLYGLGSVIAHFFYCTEDNFFYAARSFFVPVGGVLAFLVSFCCKISKVYYKRPYPYTRRLWQIVPTVALYLWLVNPILIKLANCYLFGTHCDDGTQYHLKQVLWFMAAGFFFASDIPQKYCPGKCDFVGHSHQLFHICIGLTTYNQMYGCFLDLVQESDFIRQRPPPTFLGAFGPVFCVIFCGLINLFVFRNRVKNQIVKNKMN